MSLTWEQYLHAPIRTLPRRALIIPIGASLLVHGALLLTLVYMQMEPLRPARLTDSPPETVLTLAPTPQPAPATVTPPPPPPPPQPAPQPEPKPEPVAVTHDELAAPTPTVEVKPAPPPPVIVHVPPPTPQPEPAPPPAPAASAPTPVSFAGVEAPRARRIVYAVDASGAMTSSLKFVKEELARSISRLDASQSFQVVVFREDADGKGAVEMVPSSADQLMPVTGETRISSAAWLTGVQPGGRSDPLVGLSAALKLKPDLVFLVTRSIRRSGATTEWGAGSVATLEALDKLNPVGRNGLRPTVIKTIQFLDEDPTGLLQAIAEVHGDGEGSYKVLKLQDLK